MTTQNTSQTAPEDLNFNTHLDFGNVDVEEIDIEETVNVTMLIDTSGSMQPKTPMLNKQIKLFVEKWQNSHHAPKIFFSTVRFDSDIEVLTGFQPVINVKAPVFDPRGASTKLYDGTLECLKNILTHQKNARKVGIRSKNILFILTDGADNASNYDSAREVKKLIDYVNNDEASMGTFGSIMSGIGPTPIFENAQREMGIQKLIVINDNMTDEEIMKAFEELFDFLSQSISSASSSPGALMNF